MAEKAEKLKIEKISEEAGICKLIREVCSDAKKKAAAGSTRSRCGCIV